MQNPAPGLPPGAGLFRGTIPGVPYQVRKAGSRWEVVNTDTGQTHAKHATKSKAAAQVRLLEGSDHGWHPTEGGTIRKTTSSGAPVTIHVQPKKRRSARG